ncbi:MAG: hypothetical protein ABMB14_13055 [Myxococcota bacterium]
MFDGTRFDLHMHSLRSDGRYPPEEVLARCARGRLDVVALTDHDLPNELAIGPHQIDGHTVHVVGGAEVSGMHATLEGGREQHLLVYFPGEVPEGFRAFCRAQCRERAVRYAAAVDNLALPGIAAPDDAARNGDASLTRHHLARQLVTAGHVPSLRDAFARFLGESHGRVPPLSLSFVDAIRIARSFGGVTSWAHPPVALLEAYLPAFAAAGLDAIEAIRPSVGSDERRRYRNAARKYGLVFTGGSDWHGWPGDEDLGLFRVEARELGPFLDLLATRRAA